MTNPDDDDDEPSTPTTEGKENTTTSAKAEASATDASDAEVPSNPPKSNFAIPIHSLITTSQNTHGLRHDDYIQYRSYCTRRLSRLRHAQAVRKELGHGPSSGGSSSGAGHKKGGRHAFHKRDIPVQDANKHPNYMLVTLYNAERSWSHALELKALYDDAVKSSGNSKNKSPSLAVIGGGGGAGAGGGSGVEKKNSSPGKLRSHYLRKLKKSTKYARELEEMAQVAGNATTALEAKAYRNWMLGNWCLEVGDWETACTEYGSALSICQALARGDNVHAEEGTHKSEEEDNDDGKPHNLELRDLFASRATNVLEPLLRYCQYELRRVGGGGRKSGGDDKIAMQDKVKEAEEEEEEEEDLLDSTTSSSAAQQLKSKLDARRDERLRTEASGGSMSTIHFRGRDVPVENKNLRVALLKVESLKSNLEKQKKKTIRTKGGGSGEDSKFLALLSGYDDAISIISADLKEYQAMKSGPAVNAKRFEMETLLGYVKHEKLKLLMGRNERMVNDLRNAERAIALGKRDKSASSAASTAHVDVQNKRVEEIAHLYDALLQDARAVANLPGGIAAAGLEGESGPASVEDDFVLEANANVLRLRALRCYYVARLYAADGVERYAEAGTLFDHAALLASQAAEEIAACQDMEDGDALIESMVDLEKEIEAAKSRAKACAYLAKFGAGLASSTSGRSLLRRLDDFDSGGSTYHLVDVPPALEPIPCKPTFFDIALNHVEEFPTDELQKHIDANKPQSKGILGWFRRG